MCAKNVSFQPRNRTGFGSDIKIPPHFWGVTFTNLTCSEIFVKKGCQVHFSPGFRRFFNTLAFEFQWFTRLPPRHCGATATLNKTLWIPLHRVLWYGVLEGVVRPKSYPSHAVKDVNNFGGVVIADALKPNLFCLISTLNEQKRRYNTALLAFSDFLLLFLFIQRTCWVATNGLRTTVVCCLYARSVGLDFVLGCTKGCTAGNKSPNNDVSSVKAPKSFEVFEKWCKAIPWQTVFLCETGLCGKSTSISG